MNVENKRKNATADCCSEDSLGYGVFLRHLRRCEKRAAGWSLKGTNGAWQWVKDVSCGLWKVTWKPSSKEVRICVMKFTWPVQSRPQFEARKDAPGERFESLKPERTLQESVLRVWSQKGRSRRHWQRCPVTALDPRRNFSCVPAVRDSWTATPESSETIPVLLCVSCFHLTCPKEVPRACDAGAWTPALGSERGPLTTRPPGNSPRGRLDSTVRAKSLQPCLTLCDPMDCSPPGSSAHWILQARILEWVAMPSSRGSTRPRDQTHVSCSSCIAGGFLIAEPPGKPWLQRGLNINPQLFTAALYVPLARFCSLRSLSPKKESRLGPCQPALNQSPNAFHTHRRTHRGTMIDCLEWVPPGFPLILNFL